VVGCFLGSQKSTGAGAGQFFSIFLKKQLLFYSPHRETPKNVIILIKKKRD
jgi:hypothetical protein